MPEELAALLEERDRLSADLSRTERQLAEAERHLLNGGQQYDTRFAEFFGDLHDQRARVNYDLGRLDATIEDRRAQTREIGDNEPTDQSGRWWRERAGAVAPPPPPAETRQRDWWNDNRQKTQNEQEQDHAEDREPTRNR